MYLTPHMLEKVTKYDPLALIPQIAIETCTIYLIVNIYLSVSSFCDCASFKHKCIFTLGQNLKNEDALVFFKIKICSTPLIGFTLAYNV